MDSSEALTAITRCRSCDSGGIETFFDLGDQPLANALLDKPTVDERFYPLSLSWCPACRLVQLNHTVDPRILFSQYFWVTSTSSTARRYAEQFCDMVITASPGLPGEPFILEVASNDGTFLQPFLRRGWRALGVDPAENIAQQATQQGVPTECGFFGAELASRLRQEYGAPRVVAARNVLPHVANLHDFVEGLRCAASPGGLVVVEIHWALKIMQELHYDSIYHEHLCYFTLTSLKQLFALHGLTIFDVQHSPISGGSLVCFASPNPCPVRPTVVEVLELEETSGATGLAGWRRFAAQSHHHRLLFLELLARDEVRGGKTVGYGASARSSTLLNYCGLTSAAIAAIADQNPLKHGLYTPGTHILIDGPQNVFRERPDSVVILAWNFFEEIKGILRERFGYRGNLITPLPFPPTMIRSEVLHG
ncbi:MAG: class I SAM-dependent methyltransferase [Pirellulaceae bacterium]